MSSCYVCLLETPPDGMQSKSIPQILQKHSRTVPTVLPFKHTDGYIFFLFILCLTNYSSLETVSATVENRWINK